MESLMLGALKILFKYFKKENLLLSKYQWIYNQNQWEKYWNQRSGSQCLHFGLSMV